MKKLLILICLFTLASTSVFADTMSLDDQKRIITAYGIATGQLPALPLTDEQKELPPDKCGTSVVNDFWQNRDLLDRSLMATLGVQAAGRPDSAILSRRYGSPAGRFLIHYIDTGGNAVYQPNVRTLVDSVPDYVVMIARIADSVYTHEIDSLGYPQPPADGFYASGIDNRFDIYIQNLSAQFYGLTYIDAEVTAQSFTAYMVIDNDYGSIEKYINRPLDAARVTIAHEYFHAVQFGMDVTEYDGFPSSSRRQYWMEMSAVWMEEDCYDEINDYYAYLPFFLGNPTTSLQAFGGPYVLHPYGAGIFPIFLSERFGKDIIRDIWQRCADVAGPNFLFACEAAVRNADTALNKLNLASTLGEFAIWNYFTGAYSYLAPVYKDSLWEQSAHLFGYSERENYPVISSDSIQVISSYPWSSSISSGGLNPEYNGATYLFLRYLATRDNCHGVDTSANPDTLVAISCDSVLPIYLFVDHPVFVEWAISIVYQLAEFPDSIELARFDIPVGGGGAPQLFTIQVFRPTKFRTITIAASPTTNSLLNYANLTSPGFGYAISDTGRKLESAVLTPYPNPAVVKSMEGRFLTFRFQVGNQDPIALAKVDPLLLIDVFTVAGEFVQSIEANYGGENRLGIHGEGIYETEWDMKNSAGKNVASGVYLAYARLWDSAAKKKLLAESKSKIALIR